MSAQILTMPVKMANAKQAAFQAYELIRLECDDLRRRIDWTDKESCRRYEALWERRQEAMSMWLDADKASSN